MKRRWFLALFAPTPQDIPQITILSPVLDVIRPTDNTMQLSTAPAPGTRCLVFLNGLLMAEGADYALTGQQLQFTGQDVRSMTSPIVQVSYWRARA